ncbi:MAG: hypothetical protein AAF927_14575 [Bacteroidota bacterium]
MHKFFFTVTLFTLLVLSHHLTLARPSSQIEPLINSYLTSYPFSADNLFKLAVYTELKGNFDPHSKSIHVDFGNLGTISFFSKNCLLKTSSNKVFHLMRDGSNGMPEIAAVNDALHNLFENIALLANHNADPNLVSFVDESLARKNIEPFNKIFVRHILINYGKYSATEKRVEFHTDWLPAESSAAILSKGEERLVKQHLTPLRIQLDDHFLRGYYIHSGGTVYVEDVNRTVKYATGEEYDPNVSAFKVFVQKLFVQSAHFIANTESKRLESKPRLAMFVPPKGGEIAFSHQSFIPEIERTKASPIASRKIAKPNSSKVTPLYHKYNWIGMMMAILREENISIADPDILIYFIDKPYFDKVYAALTPEEQKAVDKTRLTLE